MGYVTTTQAAKIIGCSTSHVRYLLRNNILKGRKKTDTYGNKYYAVSEKHAFLYRDLDLGGYPRGVPRNPGSHNDTYTSN